jgi:DNA helicase-2/ATP-dependent DNA helicase PcrA
MADLFDGKGDHDADSQIFGCLNPQEPKSFFLFAGAGSGKTRSLVIALEKARERYRQYFRVSRKKIAVITYTNAACDEIGRRIDFDPLFAISTIHRFAWELIRPYQIDIKTWIRATLLSDIAELQDLINGGRPGTKTALDRQIRIERKKERLGYLDQIVQFVYSPDDENDTRDSLNHAEVIQIAASFLGEKPLMQTILIQRFPILFIDESQDTKKELIESLLGVQKKFSKHFSLGLFGDTMQRIYNDGKADLGQHLPDDWLTPSKEINYRCPVRVITLINKIREKTDKRNQVPSDMNNIGIVRLFIVDRKNISGKATLENAVAEKMSLITNDILWTGKDADVKTLLLEHHMAARRMGFIDLFEALYPIGSTGLLDGSLPGLRFFTEIILPLIEALQRSDQLSVMRIVRDHSPLLTSKNLKDNKEQLARLRSVGEKVKSLAALWEDGNSPALNDIAREVFRSNLFRLPDPLYQIAKRWAQEEGTNKNEVATDPSLQEEDADEKYIDSWEIVLNGSFLQIAPYREYISDQSRFGTHQGVKGLEFPRVMVILDDDEARGFLFSYDKIFGVKLPTDTDLKNMSEGKDSTIDRTLRLFYVACSRASQSLAVVIYTSSPETITNHVVSQGWFTAEEIEVIR